MAELSFSEVEALVRSALLNAHAGASYAWARDIYPATVIYSIEVPNGANGTKTEPGNGVFYKRSYALTEGEAGWEVTLGKIETVTTKREYATVKAFSLATFSTSADGEWVEYPGLVFEAGDYPDKGVSFTPEELTEIAANFTPVKNDLEHQKTILSGKLGELTEVTAIDNGAKLFGKVRIPKWLHEVNGGVPIKVSLAFDAAKNVIGNALTLNPRIKDAQVAVAFTEFAGKRNSSRDQKDLQQVHDTAVRLGAQCGTEYTAHPPKEKKPMKLGDFLKHVFSGGGNVDLDTEIDTGGAPETKTFTKQDPEIDRLKAELAKTRTSQIKAEAVKFTDDLARDRRIIPAQAESVQSLFVAAAQDDLAAGGAKFTDEGSFEAGDRVKALKAAMTAAPQHTLTQEQLEAAKPTTSFSEQGAKPSVIDAAAIFEGRKAAAGGK